MQTQLTARAHTAAPFRGVAVQRAGVRTQALFGFGKSKKEVDEEKEAEWQRQQELMAKRKSGSLIKEANDRRRKVAETLQDRKALRAAEKAALARGEMPETLKDWKPYEKEIDQKGISGGIVVPLLPFGIKKYDEGERFDLRSPYSDAGWVDPDEQDAWSGLKKIGTKILNFSGKSEREELKPIMWATPFTKKRGEEAQPPQEPEEPKGRK